ncbi:MAG: hypothetical protein AAFX40_12070 [Cyanobacteria bacterium J06639_1]
MTRIYLDSCMIIGLIEGDRSQQQLLKKHLTTAWFSDIEAL